jgi:protein-disulfide isomerase
MKFLTGGAIAAIALVLAGCGGGAADNAQANGSAPSGPIAQIPAPNGDWTQTVTETAEGGFRMGNPDAKVKLVEYGSLTCGHCAEFSEEATEPLKNTYVKSGQVSWEFRPYLLFPTDPGISMLLKCQGATPFFHLVDQLYADQRNWAAKLQAMSPAEQEQLQSMPADQRASALVRATGVDQFFRQRGMPQGRIDACLADRAGLEQIAAVTKRATEQEGVTSTPSFFINGTMVELGAGGTAWTQLERRIRGAIGG